MDEGSEAVPVAPPRRKKRDKMLKRISAEAVREGIAHMYVGDTDWWRGRERLFVNCHSENDPGVFWSTGAKIYSDPSTF